MYSTCGCFWRSNVSPYLEMNNTESIIVQELSQVLMHVTSPLCLYSECLLVKFCDLNLLSNKTVQQIKECVCMYV